MFLREILWEWHLPCYYETLIVQMVNKLLIESFQIFKLVECTSEYVKVLRQSHQVEQICRKNKLLYFVDDLNMPARDPYDTQNAIALLR